MRVRLISAPGWVRWLVLAASIALFTGPIFAITAPSTVEAMGWRWGLLVLVTSSLITGALVHALRQPVITAYSEALGEIGTPQRVQAVKALRTGEVPADPAVLAAAVRVGDFYTAFGARRAARRQRVLAYGLPVLYAGMAILDIVFGAVRQGILWAVLAVFFAGVTVRNRYAGKRLRRNLPVLRAAAGPSHDTPSDPVDVAALTTLTRPRLLLGIALSLVLILTVTAVTLVWGRPRQDCRDAGVMINYVAEDPGMVDARQIQPGGPALESYRAWSSRIGEYAQQVSAPDLAPTAQLVASAAAEAVAIVEDARNAPVDDVGVGRRQAAYQADIGQLVAAENDLIALCHLDRN